MPQKEPQYLIRDEVYAIIDGNDSARVLLKDGGKARSLAHRMEERKIGVTPYRVARVVVMELEEDEVGYPAKVRHGR